MILMTTRGVKIGLDRSYDRKDMNMINNLANLANVEAVEQPQHLA